MEVPPRRDPANPGPTLAVLDQSAALPQVGGRRPSVASQTMGLPTRAAPSRVEGKSVHAEQEIDPNRRHLDVVAASGESVADEERGPDWNSECSATQPDIVILELHRPIVCEGPFDTSAREPPADGVAVGAG